MEAKYESVDLVEPEVVRRFARAALLAALMGAAAFVAIPISAVPGTLQMLVVFLAGLFLGPTWGALAMVLYLAAGAVGVPVFAGGAAGLGVLFGPHAGFLWTFPVAALIVGTVVHRGRDLRNPSDVSRPIVIGGLLAATVIVYVAGFSWYSWATATGLVDSFALIALPLIPGDLLKIAAALAIVETGRIDPT